VSSRVSAGELVLGALVLALAFVAVHGWGGAHAPSRWRASWVRTPGVVNPAVTPRTLSHTICVRGWTATIRPPTDYTSGLKERQLRALRLPGGPAHYQEDHLISLELGGHPTDPRNLWPEVRPRAENVDRIENELNEKICSGRMSLRDAQREISRIKHGAG
jgi:hypothetical protein